jgi:hypothetical protein
LVEQGANLRAIVSLRAGQRCGDDLAAVGIHAEVEFTPGPACLGAIFLDPPLTGPTQRQARAVHQQMQGLGTGASFGAAARPWRRHLQRGCPAAQGGVVRHGEIKAEQAHEGADQPFGLAQR